MTTTEFLVVYACCLASMLACRCVPMMLLKGRKLPEGLVSALNLIPTAAFAALVANDLFQPAALLGAFTQAGGLWDAAMPFVAAAVVVVVAVKTRSLVGCALTGVVAYALLLLV